MEQAQPNCVCASPGDTREACRDKQGNKTPCRCACHRAIPSGWADPYWLDGDLWPHTWHRYVCAKDAREPAKSLCGNWGFTRDVDHLPLPEPLDGARVCKTCRKLGRR